MWRDGRIHLDILEEQRRMRDISRSMAFNIESSKETINALYTLFDIFPSKVYLEFLEKKPLSYEIELKPETFQKIDKQLFDLEQFMDQKFTVKAAEKTYIVSIKEVVDFFDKLLAQDKAKKLRKSK